MYIITVINLKRLILLLLYHRRCRSDYSFFVVFVYSPYILPFFVVVHPNRHINLMRRITAIIFI